MLKRLLFLIVWIVFVACWADADEELKTLQVCEGETAHLECPQSETEIDVVLANFGRFSLLPCNPQTALELKTNCAYNLTLQILGQRCNGHRYCDLMVAPTIFGDPCPGTSKYLEARYRCVQTTTTAAPTTTPTPSADATNGAEYGSHASVESGEGVEFALPNKGAYPTNDQATSPSTPHQCAPEYYRLIQWPRTPRDQSSRASCPIGSQGFAFRQCGLDGYWAPETDLSNCLSDAVGTFRSDYEHVWETDAIAPLFVVEDMKVLVGSSVIAGDLIEFSQILQRTQEHNSRYSFPLNRDQLTETAKLTMRIVNELLQVGQRDAWLDLKPSEQKATANRLLKVVQRALRNVAHSIATADAFRAPFLARPHVVGSVSVTRNHAAVELPNFGQLDEDDRVLFSLADASDLLNAEFEIAYSSVAAVGPFLLRGHSQPTEGCPRTLASRILSTYASRRSDPEEHSDIPLVLSFASQRSSSQPYVECARWDEQQEEFITGEGTCEIVVHNETQTICRCTRTGHFAVLASACEFQTRYFGMNLETLALYASCLLAVVGLIVYILGLSLVEQSPPKQAFIPRNACTALIVAEILLSAWFALPRSGTLTTITFYLMQASILVAMCWLLVQMFALAYSLYELFSQRPVSKSRGLFYLVGYALPILLTLLSALFCGNFTAFLQGRQPLSANPPDLNVLGPLLILIILHLFLALLTFYTLVKHSHVGYTPCRNDSDTLRRTRSALIHFTPLLLAADAFGAFAAQFTLHPSTAWLWAICGANVAQAVFTLRVLSCQDLCSFSIFCSNKDKRYGANDLPKDSIFSPSVQSGGGSMQNITFNDTSYLKKGASHQHYFAEPPMSLPNHHASQQVYVPTCGGVHDSHYCDHTYATIPPEYYAFYQQQQMYHAQHAQNLQLQRGAQAHLPPPSLPVPPPPPAPCPYGRHDQQFQQHKMMQEQLQQQLLHQALPSSPICNQHGSSCPSLVGIRVSANGSMTPINLGSSRLQHRPSSASMSAGSGCSSASGSPYETARSSSTATTSGGTLLFRMDPSRNPPIFLDDNSG